MQNKLNWGLEILIHTRQRDFCEDLQKYFIIRKTNES